MNTQPTPRFIPPLLLEEPGHLRGSQVTRLLERIEHGAFVRPFKPQVPAPATPPDQIIFRVSLISIALCVFLFVLF